MMPTKPMEDATDVAEMAVAFHPSVLSGTTFHKDPVIDAIEAALLYGARKISKSDFLAAIEDLP
jgi:hypothetical protein